MQQTPYQPVSNDDPALPLPTRVALWVLLGVSLLILLILFEYQRKQGELVAERQKVELAQAQAEPVKAAPVPQTVPAAVALPVSAPREPLNPALFNNEMAAAELAILKDLAANDWSGEPLRTQKRLEPLLRHNDGAIRADAQKLQAALDEQLAGVLRQQARAGAEAAEDLAALGDFAGALAQLDKAKAALPADPVAARERVEKSLDEARAAIQKRREDSRDALLGAENVPGMIDKARQNIKHVDALVRDEAERRVKRYEQFQLAQQQAARVREEDARVAWLKLFADYRAAILDGNLDQAEQRVQQAGQTAVLNNLTSANRGVVLKDMLGEVTMIKLLQAQALSLPADKRPVDLPLRRGRVTGLFSGARNRSLNVTLEGGAVVSVKVETLAAGGFASLFGEKRLTEMKLHPAVWALSAHENPAAAPEFMNKNYTNAKQPLPEFWKLQFSLEAFRFAESAVVQRLQDLQTALKQNDAEKARKALDELQPALATLKEFGPISDERLDQVRQGEKLAGRLQSRQLTFQTGVFPTDAYKGFNTDQISQYLDTQNKTDVGVQFGLKVGAHGGLQRVLLKFDGLEQSINKGRVKKATLHLYQIESPRPTGATVGLFRLKRPWIPDAGTWRNYSSEKNTEWAVPGAAGEDDITSSEDASVALDAKKNVWRTFDLTRYVQDILQGRWQNNGLLMRVTNGEPDYHVRFYPESDIEGAKDMKLRPKLVLDLEFDD